MGGNGVVGVLIRVVPSPEDVCSAACQFCVRRKNLSGGMDPETFEFSPQKVDIHVKNRREITCQIHTRFPKCTPAGRKVPEGPMQGASKVGSGWVNVWCQYWCTAVVQGRGQASGRRGC